MEKPRTVRKPVQARARRRREALLDATARILEQSGYDALSTNAVAREAGTSIGALYEYFPNREALLAGLLERYGERLAGIIDEAVAGAEGDWRRAAADVVGAFARFWMDEPGYRATWLGAQSSPLLRETGARWADAFTDRLAALLAPLAPSLPRRELRRVARTAVHLVSGLLLVAVQSSPARRRELVAETVVALTAYLAARLPPPASATER